MLPCVIYLHGNSSCQLEAYKYILNIDSNVYHQYYAMMLVYSHLISQDVAILKVNIFL